jgi:hypothetical protein
MPKEDWLQKEIRKLAKVLAKLLCFKYADQHLEIVREADEALMDFLKLDAHEMTPENIAQKLIERTGDAEQVKTLSDIFKEKGLAQE